MKNWDSRQLANPLFLARNLMNVEPKPSQSNKHLHLCDLSVLVPTLYNTVHDAAFVFLIRCSEVQCTMVQSSFNNNWVNHGKSGVIPTGLVVEPYQQHESHRTQ